jgi:hypothetical protein
MGKIEIPFLYRNVLSYLLDAKYALYTMYQISLLLTVFNIRSMFLISEFNVYIKTLYITNKSKGTLWYFV